MLTIVPVDEQRRRALAAVFSAPEVQGMAALSGEREEGWGAFLFDNDTLTLLHLEADSPAVKDGLLRAILNAGRRAGILRACCKQRELADFLIGKRHAAIQDAHAPPPSRRARSRSACGARR